MRTFAFQAITAALVIVSSARVQAEGLSLPKASVRELAYDFGTVKQGAKVSHAFSLTNAGTSPLAIERIIAGCGCTAVTASSNSVAPGASEKINVTFDSAGFLGFKSRTIRVFTNDPESPSILFELKGTVEAPIQIVPRRLVFDRVVLGAGESSQEEVTVTTETEEGARLLEVKEASEELEIEPLAGNGKTRRFRVKVLPTTAGEIRDRISVDIPGVLSSPVNLPVLAVVSHPVKVSPASINLGVLKSKDKIVRKVRVERAAPGLPITVRSVTSDHPAVSAQLKADPALQKNVVEVTLDPEGVQSDVQATIEIQTDVPGAEKLSLKVSGAVPAR